MSSKIRTKVDHKLIESEHVDAATKKKCLQTALFNIADINVFLGSVLQCMDIYYTHMIPRAGIMFEADAKKWQMAINPKWFCHKLNDKQRVAVLQHELYHITHKHPMRAPFLKLAPHKRMLMNIAMDMAINQYIINLPKGCQSCPPIEEQFKGKRCENEMCPGGVIDIAHYYDTDDKGNKAPWTPKMPFEHYFNLLLKRFQDNDEDGEDGDGLGEGQGSGEGPQEEFDSHQWESNAEEGEVMGATEELIKRAMQKASLTYDKLDAHIKELLQDIEARRAELNHKNIILSAIKKNASGFNREHSWTRKSRRFGNKAPGTRNGKLPQLDNYMDTSGSISVQEANDHMAIIDEFLKVGSRKCHVGLWHTNLYYHKPYKLGDRIPREDFQSGGTDVEPVLKKIYEAKPDLAIIYTDGCYSDVDVESWLKGNELFPQVLWIISKDGMENHPLKRIGETIKIPKTDALASDRDLESI